MAKCRVCNKGGNYRLDIHNGNVLIVIFLCFDCIARISTGKVNLGVCFKCSTVFIGKKCPKCR